MKTRRRWRLRERRGALNKLDFIAAEFDNYARDATSNLWAKSSSA